MENALEDLVVQTLTLGREQGVAEGREQGRLEARRDDLAHLVLHRFQLRKLPASLAERLAQADEATLLDLRDCVLEVTSVDEL